jgi:hypothetical protein
MTLAAVLLGGILLVLVGGGRFLYRVLMAVRRMLEAINGKLPSSGLVTSLLSIWRWNNDANRQHWHSVVGRTIGHEQYASQMVCRTH